MDKNWLIRTKQNQILGPVSKEKVLEFVNKGALKADDEVCSGNGFWFRISEQSLVDKYLWGNATQPFNPVSECISRLCKSSQVVEQHTGMSDYVPDSDTPTTQVINLKNLKNEESASTTDETKLPSNDDLEYPSFGGPANNAGSVMAPKAAGENKNNSSEEQEIDHHPSNDDLEYPDFKKENTGGWSFDLNEGKQNVDKKSEVKNLSNATDKNEEDPINLPNKSDLDYPDLELEHTKKR